MNTDYHPFVFDSTVTDFSFMAAVPKREKSKLGKFIDSFRELSAMHQEHGCPIPRTAAAKILNVHPTRIDQMISDGQLVSVKFNGHIYVSENSVVALGQKERKAGRPLKLVDECKASKSALWKLAKETAPEYLQK